MAPLGEHVVWSPRSFADIGPHVFPMEKYAGVIERLRAEDGLDGWVEPRPAEREELLRVHTPAYLDDLDDARHTERTRWSELPISPEIVAFFVLACGGTTLAARRALDLGWAYHAGGGFHHAFADRAEGFCYLNDLAVAARTLQAEGAVERILVVDVDVHQGNGTAGIFRGDPSVFTLSIHQEDNYPVKTPGDLDVGLLSHDPRRPGGPGVTDAVYLAALEPALEAALDAARPDLALVQAGADPYAGDRLGGFRLTIEGLKARDEMVFRACRRRGVPWAVTLGGGYAERVDDTIAIHAGTARAAAAVAGGG